MGRCSYRPACKGTGGRQMKKQGKKQSLAGVAPNCAATWEGCEWGSHVSCCSSGICNSGLRLATACVKQVVAGLDPTTLDLQQVRQK